MGPKISIVTAVKNGAAYLPDLVESVLSQDYANFEHIVIDDGSTDDTAKVLARYPHLHWWSRENKGLFPTVNEGLAATTGDIVSVINSDDYYLPEVFDAVARHWQDHPYCDVLYGRTRTLHRDGRLFSKNIHALNGFSKRLVPHYVLIQHCSLFVSRQFLIGGGLWFAPDLRYTGDTDWVIRMFGRAEEIGYVSRPLSVLRAHEGQTSRDSMLTQKIEAEHRAICEKHGTSYALYRVLNTFFCYRAMALMALEILQKEGLTTTLKECASWLGRRFRSR